MMKAMKAMKAKSGTHVRSTNKGSDMVPKVISKSVPGVMGASTARGLSTIGVKRGPSLKK